MLDVDDLRSVNPTIRTEYNKRKNKWLSEHCERKYTPEYYELFNNLSPLAADARELVQIKIHKLLDTVKTLMDSMTQVSYQKKIKVN